MKNVSLLMLLLFYLNSSFAGNYKKIDEESSTIPAQLKTAEEIAQYLTKNLTTPTDKVRSIYFWIAQNIKYDLAKLNPNATYFDTQELVDDVLKTRKGVCANYAQLFHSCCQSVGVQSYVINGYTTQNGQLATISHAWNAVKIDSQYYCIDVTWAAGYIENGKYVHAFRDEYFLIEPREFIKSHVPFDPIWQFSNQPLTHKEIAKSNFSTFKVDANYNFGDSIALYMSLNSLEKTIAENRRIFKSGISNSLIEKQYKFNEQLIENFNYNLMVEKLQQSQELFNKSIEDYNVYIQSKNRQFENTTLEDDKIMEMVSISRNKMERAAGELESIHSTNYEFNRLLDEIQNAIKKLKQSLESEEKFIEKYINTAQPFRKLLFLSQGK